MTGATVHSDRDTVNRSLIAQLVTLTVGWGYNTVPIWI